MCRGFARYEFFEVTVEIFVSLADAASFIVDPWRFVRVGVVSVSVRLVEVSPVSFLNPSSPVWCFVFSLVVGNPSKRGVGSCFFGCSANVREALVSLGAVRMSCCSRSHSCLTCEEHSSASLMNCRATAMFLSSSLSRDSTWSASAVFAMSEKVLVSLPCNFDISTSTTVSQASNLTLMFPRLTSQGTPHLQGENWSLSVPASTQLTQKGV